MDVSLQKLLEVEDQKTMILEKGSVDDLNALMNSEQALIMECNAQEKRRLVLCDELNVETVAELIEKYPDTINTIGPLHESIGNTVNSIKKVGTLNMKLIETRMKIINFLTSQIGVMSDNTKYGKNARIV